MIKPLLYALSVLFAGGAAAGQTTAQAPPQVQTTAAVSSESDRLTVRTNLLYDAFMLPTLGVEWRANPQLGIKLDGGYAYWGDEHGKVQKMWLVNPELRWYPLAKSKKFYTGVSANFAKYNLYDGLLIRELGGSVNQGNHGYQGTAWGAGVVAGYKLSLSRRFALDFNVGLGYTRMDYDTFEVVDRTRYKQEAGLRKNFFGPTQAGVNLIWIIR
ncbi:MAG: DUF3575 domain-containing protein [Alistipes sp.]|nr:DUF3575 domain-containing protein [Alistipes sp.]